MKEWAENEVRLAKNLLDPDDDYSMGCYDSALKAFNSLVEDGHSGYSIYATKCILNNLIDGKPLTKILDNDFVYVFEGVRDGKKYKTYQCKRMYSLFKKVFDDGSVEYTDNDRILTYDNTNDYCCHSSMVTRFMDKLYPISLPYNGETIKVYTNTYKLNKNVKGDFDTLFINYYVKDDKVHKVKKYFTEIGDDMVEISKIKYLLLKISGKIKYQQ